MSSKKDLPSSEKLLNEAQVSLENALAQLKNETVPLQEQIILASSVLESAQQNLSTLRDKLESKNNNLSQISNALKALGIKTETTRNLSSDKSEAPIDELNLSVRAYNILMRNKIKTIGDLKSLTSEELKEIKNLGIRGFEEIESAKSKYPYFSS